MKTLIVFSVLIFLSIIEISDSFGTEIEPEFGEYASQGNVWFEITHSFAQPPPWKVWKSSFHDNPPYFFKDIFSELDEAKKFYEIFDIELQDLISSNKNEQVCEVTGCLHGTYHLLVSEKDGEKLQIMDYNYIISKTIPPKKQQSMLILNNEILCNPELDLVFKSSNYSSACVKPESIPKLIERGWAKSTVNQIEYASIYEEKFPSPDFDYQNIIQKLEKNEDVFAIVSLNTENTRFEGIKGNLELKSKIVTELQDSVISDLPNSQKQFIKKFQYVPEFAIKLDIRNLDYLVKSPLIKSISEDKAEGIP